MQRKDNMKTGFTLIELLIVVAIIAILAAIAIPNFLAAQTRSKVSKLKAEFKTLATAVESYNVDANSYPIHRSTYSSPQNGVFGDDDPTIGSNRFDVLTTPVAYITSVPQDPFRFVGSGGQSAASGIGYFLYCWDKYSVVRAIPGLDNSGPFNPIWHASYWGLRSRGTNGKWDGLVDPNNNAAGAAYPWYNIAPFCIDGDVTLVSYDPTNGTISYGDIYRTSKRGQF